MAITARETQVKPGYKLTEVGVIPEEWEVKKLGEVADFLDGRRKPIKENNRAKMRGVYPYYGASGIVDYVNDYIFDEELILLGEDGENIVSRNCKLAFLVSGKIWVNNHAHVLRAKINTNPNFLVEYLESLDYEQYNTGTAQPKLNKSVCLEIPVISPTLPEQQVIAASLSDVDALLALLDKLIAKKRALKQATMQQLLTGKTRLPGFNGEWNSRLLSDICWFQEGPGVRNTQFTRSGIKLLNGTNIFRGEVNLESTDRFISEKEAYGTYAHFLADLGDIVIACSGITIDKFHEKVAFVRNAHLPLCMNTSTMRFKPFNNYLLPSFLYHLLMSDIFKKQIGLQATGSAQLNFGPSHVANVVFALPEIKEQLAIAAVLGDMDAEIVALEQRREKTRALKQGMMQELLTGRIRLQ